VTYGTLTEGPWLDPLTMFEDVFHEMPANLERQREELGRLVQNRAAAAPPAHDADTQTLAGEG
jgi:hypothetical protein